MDLDPFTGPIVLVNLFAFRNRRDMHHDWAGVDEDYR
jgi:hypothetical protein